MEKTEVSPPLLIQRVSPHLGQSLPLPAYATDGAAGLDLCACLEEPVTLPGGGECILPTGVAVAIPEGYVGLLMARSSMGFQHGIVLSTNGVGVIDSDYRGDIRVGLWNRRDTPYTIHPGDRIAQLLLVPVLRPELLWTDALPETVRGSGGFGSTGR